MTTSPELPSTPSAALQGAVQLDHLGVIAVDGDDAASFLHSQLTQDFAVLGLGEARLAGYCSAKGRLLASFVAWKEAHDRLRLVCSADVLPAALKRLSMFVLRAKAKLSDASATTRLIGLAGEAARDWLGDDAPAQVWGRTQVAGASIIRLPDAAGQPRFLWAGAAEAAPEQDSDPEQALPALPLSTWQWLEVQSAVPRIVGATVEQFVPQMVNLESVGGVNFQKGCYPGQEVVARSQYRGTLKRRGFLLHGDAPLVPGQEIFHSADPGQPSGMVVNAAPAPAGGWSAFAELKLSATEGGSLHLGSADGPGLNLLPLPYELAPQA
jgi:folate-binding protein YgfZ